MHQLAVIDSAQLVTLNNFTAKGPINEFTLGIIEDGALVVDEGRISWVGTSKELRQSGIEAKKIINAEGCLVTPGFVDPHTHLIFAGSREDELDRKMSGESYMEILRSGGGIIRTIRETRKSGIKKLLEESMLRLNNLVRNGVTTIEVKTGYGQNLKDELKMLKVANLLNKSGVDVVPTYLGLHALPEEFRSAEEYSVYVIKEVIPTISSYSYRPIFSDCFCEEGIFDKNICRKYLLASRKYGLKLKIHADEFSRAGGAELAAELGCISADHLENSSKRAFRMMAKRGVSAVLLPGTAFYSRISYPDIGSIRDSGCNIALGTDISPNSWIESPQLVMALAVNEMRMTAAESLVAFTAGASLALGLTDRGMIKVGMKADFVIHDIPNYKFLPYRIGGNYIRYVFKDGQELAPPQPTDF